MAHEGGCCSGASGSGTRQTLDEMAFERGIWTAAINNDVSRIKHILATRGHEEVNSRDSSGLTGLHYAARSGSLEALRLLIGSGADVNARANSGASPIHRAAYMGHEEIVQLLIGNGADPEVSDDDGKTALHKCAERGHFNCAQKIVSALSPTSSERLKMATDKHGLTALECCPDSSESRWQALLLSQQNA